MGFNNVIVGTGRRPLNRRGCVAAVGIVVCATLVSACGQRGSLYLPAEAAARNRATLPQTLLPSDDTTTAPASTAPASTAPASTAPTSGSTTPTTTPLSVPATPSSASR